MRLLLPVAPPRWLVTTAAITLAAAIIRAADKPVMFEDMDYGPTFAYTIQGEWPKDNGNLAVKGLAIKLDGGKAGVLFDMDLMRVAAAWVNDSDKPYLDLSRTNMTSYKGDALAFPRGKRVFGTQVTPGWAFDGSFKDTREAPYGRLPDKHAKFKGYYLHEDKVVLSYEVEGAPVLDMPHVVVKRGVTYFVREIEVGPGDKPLTVRLFDIPESDALWWSYFDGPSPHFVGLRLTHGEGKDALVIEALIAGERATFGGFTSKPGATKGTYRTTSCDVVFKSSTKARRATIAIHSGNADHQEDAFSNHSLDLTALTKGGPQRWPTVVTTQGSRGKDDATGAPYILDRITCPEENPYHAWIRPTGFDFFPDGKRAAICTWNGDVWIVDGIGDTLQSLRWKRFATGLHEPLGVVIMNGDVFTTGRDQITRLHDYNNDGEADYYETFNNDGIAWPRTMAMELHRDAEGNLYYIKNGNRVPGNIPLQGCIFKVSPDGKKQEVYATGFRSANGLSVSPDGLVTIADQEGNWVPTTRLDLVKPGKFYGYRPHSHGMVPETPTTDPPHDYELPMCWIPKPVDNSAGGQAWITSDTWGPFKGRLVHTSYGKARLFLTMYETIDGVTQGGIVQLPLTFDSGIMRARVNPADGQLYVLGMRGWQTDGSRDSGFFRVRYTGKTVNMPRMINVKHDGVLITFTDPLDKASAADTGNYAAERWNYVYAAKYGSDEFSVENPRRKGHDPVDIEAAQVSADGRSVLLKIPDIMPVMQQSIRFNLKAADGSPVNYTIYHTIHKVP